MPRRDPAARHGGRTASSDVRWSVRWANQAELINLRPLSEVAKPNVNFARFRFCKSPRRPLSHCFEMNVIVPLGGLGQRFQNEGYARSKPFVRVLGKEMILWVLDHLRLAGDRVQPVLPLDGRVDGRDRQESLPRLCAG